MTIPDAVSEASLDNLTGNPVWIADSEFYPLSWRFSDANEVLVPRRF